ncbi:MAG: response regulator [Bryobacterales bacterium]|nr:response regulator [Bryobacterales bacterium]
MPQSGHRDEALEALLLRLGNGVRETLHNVMGLLELTLQEPLSASQTRYLHQCRAVADRLLRVSNDAAELASSHDWPVQETSFSVRGMVEELAQLATPLAARSGVRFQHHIAAEVPLSVKADRVLLQDMIHRLLDNSLQATESGYVQLSVKLAPALEDCLLFEVADSGPGFPEELLAHLHAPLTSEQGRGLGLPIVRRRAQSMGGAFTVLSSSATGSVVLLAVPVKPAGQAMRPAATAGQEPMSILVVEDCDDSYQLFEAYVAGHGHRVTRVVDGAQALAACRKQAFDIVFMDVNMPVMDGYTATRAIRDWETANAQTRIPIVLLSADDRGRQRSLGAAAGCSGYLTKPTPQADLLAALEYYGKPLVAA